SFGRVYEWLPAWHEIAPTTPYPLSFGRIIESQKRMGWNMIAARDSLKMIFFVSLLDALVFVYFSVARIVGEIEDEICDEGMTCERNGVVNVDMDESDLDFYVAEVYDNTNCNVRHVVKLSEK
ncbi:hypothetical protein ACJX0J_007303, partial [Zea mays]